MSKVTGNPTGITEINRTTRGALKVNIDTSKSIVRAGESFSVFVTIGNPFDTPVTIQTVETHLPIELRDLFGEYLARREMRQQREDEFRNIDSVSKKIGRRIFYMLSDYINSSKEEIKPQIGQAYSTKERSLTPTYHHSVRTIREVHHPDGSKTSSTSETVTSLSSAPTITVIPRQNDTTVLLSSDDTQAGWRRDLDPQDVNHIEPVNNDDTSNSDGYESYSVTTDEEVHSELYNQDKREGNNDIVIIRPGNSVVKQFLFKTRNWLFFTPFRHRMIVQIRYTVDSSVNYDTSPYDLDIRASLSATILGGVIGGFCGSLTRSSDISAWTSAAILFPAIISAIFSAITIVAFARKSDTQPLVAVEDFLGGLLLGFIVGYTGNVLFQEVVEGFKTGSS